MKRVWLALALTSLTLWTWVSANSADAQTRLAGPRFSTPAEAVVFDDRLAEALGPASYLLNDAGPSESFQATIRRAVSLHPLYSRDMSAFRQARAQIERERAVRYPRVSTRLSSGNVIARAFETGTDNVVESLRPRTQTSAGLSVSQLLFDGGVASARIKAPSAQRRSAQHSLKVKTDELALSTLSAYYDVLAHQAILPLGGSYIRRHGTLLENVKERARLGAGTQADVMQATAQLAAARLRVSEVHESLRLAEIRFRELFNTAPGALQRASFDSPAVDSQEEAVREALRNNPEIAAAVARADRAQANYKAVRARRFPEIRATTDAVTYNPFEDNDYNVRGGLFLNYSLFDGGSRSAAINQAMEAGRQFRFEGEDIRREIEREAAAAFERRAGITERLALLADTLTAQYKARDLLSEPFHVAKGELIDLLQAESDYFESAVAYLVTLADREMATYELMRHTGRLSHYFSPD